MTFREFLQSMNIDSSTSGADGIVYAAVSMIPDVDFRTGSLIFADVPGIRDHFASLWYAYEDTLDRMNYHKEQHDLVPVSVIIDEVVADLRKRCSSEAGND